jgi:voltage-gated potassium channel
MNAAIDPEAAPDNRRQWWEDHLAGPMFFLSALFLVVLAGLIHRYPHLQSGDLEVYLIQGGLGILWMVFLVEGIVRFGLRERQRPPWKPFLAAAVGGLLPPLRMGCPSQVRPNHLWLPGLGWQPINSRLRRTLGQAFSIPMIFFALMVLPMLVLEYYMSDPVRSQPVLALWVDIGTSVIWLAFAFELILMVSVSDRPGRYCLLHWIDVAIDLLPLVEVLPLLRLLRLGRILRVEQVLRWGRLARLQSLVSHVWRAFLLLQIVQRLMGHSLEHRLKKLRELLQAKEEELADVRQEIKELEERIARETANHAAEALAPEVTQTPAPGADPIHQACTE